MIFRKNLLLKYIYLGSNQISSVENGTFDAMSILITLDLSNNTLTTIYPITVGSDINLNFNLLKTINISSSFTKLQFKSNRVASLICADKLNMKTLDASNNSLTSMNCIKKMINITDLNLSFNKFHKLSKMSFGNLKLLSKLDLSYNLIKKLGLQIFSPLVSLKTLKVDKLIVYKKIHDKIPKLTDLSLTTKLWNCTYIQGIASTINVDNVTLNYNSMTTDTSVPVCDMKSSVVNKIIK